MPILTIKVFVPGKFETYSNINNIALSFCDDGISHGPMVISSGTL